MKAIDRILPRLEGATETQPNRWLALCPAHDDHSPSLSVTDKDNRVLLKCHAGCSTEAVVAALGLEMGDLFDDDSGPAGKSSPSKGKSSLPAGKSDKKKKKKAWPSPVHFGLWAAKRSKATPSGWMYQDAGGVDCFAVIRLDGEDRHGVKVKTYLPLHKAADGWYVGDPPDREKLPIYSLPDVMASDTIYFCEGEKAAQAGIDLGLACTTSPHGAKSAARADYSPLRGKHVVILPDNDDPGQEFANAVCHLVKDLAASVKVLQLPGLPAAGDLVDYLEAANGRERHEIREEIKNLAVVAPAWSASTGLEIGIADIRAYPQSDLGNSQRFLDVFGNEFLFCPFLGGWLQWDGARWKRDSLLAAQEKMKSIPEELYARASSFQSEFKHEAKWALASQSRRHIDAALGLARSSVAVSIDDLDGPATGWLLNCQNGTIDLRTGQLREHRQSDRITRLAPVEYRPHAQPGHEWMKFLIRIFDDNAPLVAFVQRVLGMALTADVSEQKMFVFWGSGQNGKNTLLDTILYTIGDYATMAAPGLLIEKSTDEHPTQVANLAGRRLVISSETAEGKKLNENLVKDITGNSTLKARYMRGDYFEFPLTFKLVLMTNHKPRVRENTYAIWRRLCLVPFTTQIGEKERDPHLAGKLRAEAPSILTWLVKGCLEWQRNGLCIPEEIKDATDKYREDEDPLNEWLKECCFLAPNAKTSRNSLYFSYISWCETRGDKYPISRRGFYERLRMSFSEGSARIFEGATKVDRVFEGISLMKHENSTQHEIT